MQLTISPWNVVHYPLDQLPGGISSPLPSIPKKTGTPKWSMIVRAVTWPTASPTLSRQSVWYVAHLNRDKVHSGNGHEISAGTWCLIFHSSSTTGTCFWKRCLKNSLWKLGDLFCLQLKWEWNFFSLKNVRRIKMYCALKGVSCMHETKINFKQLLKFHFVSAH